MGLQKTKKTKQENVDCIGGKLSLQVSKARVASVTSVSSVVQVFSGTVDSARKPFADAQSPYSATSKLDISTNIA